MGERTVIASFDDELLHTLRRLRLPAYNFSGALPGEHFRRAPYLFHRMGFLKVRGVTDVTDGLPQGEGRARVRRGLRVCGGWAARATGEDTRVARGVMQYRRRLLDRVSESALPCHTPPSSRRRG